MADLLLLTPLEWTVVGLATACCLLGSLLPKIGNLLGRLFLGEYPLLARWQAARLVQRERAQAQRLARREAKKLRKDKASGAAT